MTGASSTLAQSRARALRGRRTRLLDLGATTVLPGLVDAHLHLLAAGQSLHEVDMFGGPSFAEVVRRTLAFAAGSRDAWLVGDGWDQNRWPDQTFPTHEALSAALSDRPVVLFRVDGHALLANARAMALAGITASTPEPVGERILRDAQGAPSGVFVDAAMGLATRAIPAPATTSSCAPPAPRWLSAIAGA